MAVANGHTLAVDDRGLESARRSLSGPAAAKPLAATERDQLAHDIAAIEHAAAALRKAQPALTSSAPPPPSAVKARPLWQLIGVLWLSTMIVTAGAVVAIHSFAG